MSDIPTRFTRFFPIATFFTCSLLVVILISNHFHSWEYSYRYQSGKPLFWLWIRMIFWTVVVYNIFRVYDYTYTTPASIQEEHRKLMLKIMLVFTVIFSPFITHYIISIGLNIWEVQGYGKESAGNIVWRVIKGSIGVAFLMVKYIYVEFRNFIKGALQEVGFIGEAIKFTFQGEIYTAEDLRLYDFLAGFVVYLIYQYRKVILRISNFFYAVLIFLKNITVGKQSDIMDKGLPRVVFKRTKWLKGLVFFLLGIEEKADISRGSAAFAKKSEERELVHKKKEGLLIDGVNSITWDLSMRHIAILAPSGQGKTSNYVIPNILSLPEFINPKSGTSASAVITDPKGEIFETTAQYLSEQGYQIQVIRVDEPLQSELFNPIHRASSDKEITKLAKIMVDSVTSESKGQGFWNDSAKMTLSNIIKIIKRSNIPAKYHNLHNIKRFIDLMGSDGKPLIDFVRDYCEDAEAITEYASFTQQNDRTVSSILMTIKTVLKDLSVREIAQLTSKDTVDFAALRSKKSVLYIITPIFDIEYYRFFLTNLYSQLFAYCEKNGKGNDILFMMDEFGNLGKIPSFPQLITTLRSKRCSISLIMQDIAQLQATYKSEASSIINGGCSSQILFGGIRNREVLEDASKLLGDRTMQQKNDKGKTVGSFARRLMAPDEIARMQMGEGIFISSVSKPIKLNMVQFEESHLKERLRKDDFGDYIVPPTHDREESELPVRYFDFDQYIKDEDE